MMHPLMAILRGLEPKNALDVAQLLFEEGFRTLEVPLNSPSPLLSIEKIKDHFGTQMVVGAGTVLSDQNVIDVHHAGGELIVSPNCNPSVIEKTRELEMISSPGVMSISEAFVALHHGAHYLKLFPCEAIPPAVVKAFRAVLPKECQLLAVGGIDLHNMKDYLQAGVQGFGFGSSIFTPQLSLDDIRSKAQKITSLYAQQIKN